MISSWWQIAIMWAFYIVLVFVIGCVVYAVFTA